MHGFTSAQTPQQAAEPAQGRGNAPSSRFQHHFQSLLCFVAVTLSVSQLSTERFLVLTCFIKLALDGFRTAGRQIECRLGSPSFCGPPLKFFRPFPKGTVQGRIVNFSCDHCRIHPYFYHLADWVKSWFIRGG